jgi:galactitol-specific phosphotransferase system IIB component
MEKLYLLKLFQEWGKKGIKENGVCGEGVNSSMVYFIYCKNFCKYHNVPPPSTTIEKVHLNQNFKKGNINVMMHMACKHAIFKKHLVFIISFTFPENCIII